MVKKIFLVKESSNMALNPNAIIFFIVSILIVYKHLSKVRMFSIVCFTVILMSRIRFQQLVYILVHSIWLLKFLRNLVSIYIKIKFLVFTCAVSLCANKQLRPIY